jgi:hypothetical protein
MLTVLPNTETFDHIFLPVALATISIAATRMHRSLVGYNSSTEVYAIFLSCHVSVLVQFD